jgi:tyrosine aminotransferase
MSSISKMYQVPGWRVGWMIIYNHHGYFDKVKLNIQKYAMINLPSSTPVQQAVPKILRDYPESASIEFCQKIEKTANYLYNALLGIRGIEPIKVNAAMYMMVRIELSEFKDIVDDADFVMKFFTEENVSTYPSEIFNAKGFIRLVTTPTAALVDDLKIRLVEFCGRHYN